MALQAFRRVGLGRPCRQPMVELVDANGRRIQNWFPDFGDLARGIAFEIAPSGPDSRTGSSGQEWGGQTARPPRPISADSTQFVGGTWRDAAVPAG